MIYVGSLHTDRDIQMDIGGFFTHRYRHTYGYRLVFETQIDINRFFTHR